MQYFFQESFISSVRILLKKKSYKDCEQALITNIFKVNQEEFFETCIAFRLNTDAQNPIVKLRIAHNKGKSRSYRLYFFVVIKKNSLYFGHLYPKTGTKGKKALSKKEEIKVIKALLSDVKDKNIKEVYWNTQKNKICFLSDDTHVW